ncbi:MauE/DoxX family redox-associated membrane protein [Pseudodesulfovibrio sp. zrk46]|uniref:MauE/DoxX family redox-associated membrane protein n=1 Tax=Pseudodesulfovibrio sp. zrk46 TaxID=2725288 RepID=UPI0014494277|nr:MauE/DoxX family redox-associated membrane protein [Pseudodesulfovibrio sp. zrk46]QJB56228.1 DoxX family membrane protein [Pseudodesulfovibrio sp. zrk46]
MKKIFTSKLLYLALRIALGGVFVYAGLSKITDPDGFAMAIDGYGLVSWRIANLLARVLPVVEIVSGLGLIFDVRGALGMIVAQLLGFVCVLAYGIHMGLDVDCGCFGPNDPGAGEPGGLWGTLIRDLLMLGACLLMYWQRRIAGFVPRSLVRRTSPN